METDTRKIDDLTAQKILDFYVERAYGTNAFITKDCMLHMRGQSFYLIAFDKCVKGCDDGDDMSPAYYTHSVIRRRHDGCTWCDVLHDLLSYVKEPGKFISYLPDRPILVDSKTTIEEALVNIDMSSEAS